MKTQQHLLVFQMCSVSSSTLSCLSACSSKKSKKYLTAGGTTELEHNTLRKKSSTNCCKVPCKTHARRFKSEVKHIGRGEDQEQDYRMNVVICLPPLAVSVITLLTHHAPPSRCNTKHIGLGAPWRTAAWSGRSQWWLWSWPCPWCCLSLTSPHRCRRPASPGGRCGLPPAASSLLVTRRHTQNIYSSSLPSKWFFPVRVLGCIRRMDNRRTLSEAKAVSHTLKCDFLSAQTVTIMNKNSGYRTWATSHLRLSVCGLVYLYLWGPNTGTTLWGPKSFGLG